MSRGSGASRVVAPTSTDTFVSRRTMCVGEAVPPADCSSHTTHAFDDEAEALAAGVAALVAR